MRTDNLVSSQVSAGGEAVTDGSASLHIDVHHRDLEYLSLSGLWHDWGIGTQCEDLGYRLRHISDANVWAEEIP